MALLALRSEASRVDVVTCMAGAADHRRLDTILGSQVTVRTTYLCVGADQGKACVRGMVEVPPLPAVGCMARAAIFAESPRVHVVLRMAATAILGRVLETLGRVALSAGDDRMKSHQRVSRGVMVERHIPPGADGMTGLAGAGERPGVRIICPMTVLTSGSQLLLSGDAAVTGVTIQAGMRTCQ